MPQTNGSPIAQLENTLEEYFAQKAPYQLPHDAKEAIVIFGALTLSALFSPMGYAAGVSMYWIIPTVILILSVILNLLALPGLFNRTIQGWRYAYYAELLSILSTVLSGNIVGALVGAILGFYILFQVKSLYK